VTENLRDRLRLAGVKAVWIQGWQVAGYWQTAFAAKAVGAELWLRAESNDLAPTPLWKRLVKKIVLGRLFSMINRFLYIGEANKRLYGSFGVPEARLSSAPYAVDNERFARQAAALHGKRAELRRQWGIADDAFCVLFCGKFIGKKRPLDLVKAAQALRGDGRIPGIHLLFVGAGELGGALRAACNVVQDAVETGANQCAPPSGRPPATFAGFLNQSEICQAYVAADCLVLPSDHGETWGLVVNEAMASGLPCIVSDACGCAEDLAGPDWSYPLGDVAALAGRLDRMRKSLPLRIVRPPSFGNTVSAIVSAWQSLRE